RNITLYIDDSALDHVAKAGFDPTYGARPLKRAIQKEIETPLAKLILAGKVADGQTLNASYDSAKGALTFTAEAGAAAAPRD
ncbi:MAG: hypothetical protein ACREDR_01165, partial [Blastocatellia bacterium]